MSCRLCQDVPRSSWCDLQAQRASLDGPVSQLTGPGVPVPSKPSQSSPQAPPHLGMCPPALQERVAQPGELLRAPPRTRTLSRPVGSPSLWFLGTEERVSELQKSPGNGKGRAGGWRQRPLGLPLWGGRRGSCPAGPSPLSALGLEGGVWRGRGRAKPAQTGLQEADGDRSWGVLEHSEAAREGRKPRPSPVRWTGLVFPGLGGAVESPPL